MTQRRLHITIDIDNGEFFLRGEVKQDGIVIAAASGIVAPPGELLRAIERLINNFPGRLDKLKELLEGGAE